MGSLRWLSYKSTVSESNLTRLEGSKLINSWLVAASGNIGRISGKTITLTKEKEVLNIIVRDNALIFSSSRPETKADLTQESKQEKIDFNDLQVGDYLSVLAEVNSKGELETSNVFPTCVGVNRSI